MKRVVSLSPIPDIILSELLKQHGIEDTEVIDASGCKPQQVLEAVREAEYIIGDYSARRPITREIARAARSCKLIQQPSVGYEHIDIEACREAGIDVANAAGANTIAVAEHTVMTGLCLLKNIFYAHRTTAAGEWRQMEVRPVELFNRTWGFIGFGRIGKAVAERLVPFGPRMLYYDIARLSAQEEQRLRVAFVQLKDLLKSADVLSLHCPLTRETAGLINRDNISLMKQGAILINVARGEIVEEEALLEALKGGKIGGAALDVFRTEPVDPANPLLAAGNVILSPHVAGVTQEAQGRIITATIANIARVMRGEPPENVVNQAGR